jgi:RHS repeat-associated protein
VAYDRFGAKVSQTYGNGLVTDYTYENLTRRLSQISVTDNSSNPYSDIQYGYDPVGNVIQANSNCPWYPAQGFMEIFTYDASDQLVSLLFLCSPKEKKQKEKALAAVEKNPVHYARQLAERRNPLRLHRSTPLPCYGRRIFSFTPHVSDMTLTTCEIQRLLQWQNATMSAEGTPCNLLFSFLCFVSFFFSGRRKKERNEGKNFYYHTNHLGSTAFVTDQNQTVTQGFLYAPFGEITTEYNATFGNDVIPKYSFNAKELDEETGMYYYEARYYKPPVFTSRDAMFEKKPWLCPYHYCSNNPVGRVDPTGLFDKEKQAERSRKKAIKQYGENRVSGIKISESGQYYYNVSEKDEVTTNKDGYKILDDQIVLNSTTVKAGKDRSVYSRNAYKDLVKADMRDDQLEKSFSYRAIKSMYDFDEKFQEAAYSFLSGAILYIPLVGVPNDIKTLVTGEDIYENSATKGDKFWAAAGIVTLGTSKWLKKAGKAIHKQINKLDKMIDTRSAIKTSINNNDDD